MIKTYFLLVVLLVATNLAKYQTDSLTLPFDSPQEINWIGKEKHYFSPIWDTDVVAFL
jgi:hypothetical protein